MLQLSTQYWLEGQLPSCVQVAPGEPQPPKKPVVLPEFPQSPPMQTLLLQPALPPQDPALQA
jgi:hypothetical protein